VLVSRCNARCHAFVVLNTMSNARHLGYDGATLYVELIMNSGFLRSFSLFQWFVVTLGTLLITSVEAQTSMRTPVEHFFKNSTATDVSLSPSGRYLATIAPVGKRDGIVVIDLDNMKGEIAAGFSDSDIQGMEWVNDERIVYWLTDKQSGWGEQRGSGLFAVNRNGKEQRTLAPTRDWGARVWRHPSFEAVLRDGSDDILVTAGERDERSRDAYRLNTRTGRKTILTFENPGFARRYVFDKEGIPRAAVGGDQGGQIEYYYVRDKVDDKWTEVYRRNANLGEPGWRPIAFDFDGSLLVAQSVNSDTTGLHRFDWATKKRGEKLAAHSRYDIGGGLIFDRVSRKLVGIRAQLDKAQTVWIDEQWASWQASIDGALPGMVNLLSRSDGKRVLIASYSDRAPRSWYLFEPTSGKLERVASSRPWIDPAKMATQKFVQYKARDGMMIPAYVTTPAGSDGKNLPLVVLIHGGPNVRGETWGWNPQAQFLASRGYAVLQADFRGSEGYGWKHFRAGWKQWGLTMQDDLTDGAAYLVAEGLADKNRMCLMGGSYGGYATMQGLVREPEMFKCGVNMVGVTDLILMHEVTWSDFAGSEGAMASLRTRMGEPEKDRENLIRTSPARNADRIKAPVMIVHGAEDRRVPIVHATTMRDALIKVGNTPEWIVYNDEAHGFGLEANKYDLYTRIEAFLEKHIGK
jgi:dipeptidyl aminopeptidase/acylaminoacyl peptidase